MSNDSARSRSQWERRVRVRLSDPPHSPEAYGAGAEDTILHKLLWHRMGGEMSERQRLNVLGILRVPASDLDTPYLVAWSRRPGVDGLLQRAIQEARG